MVWIAGKVDRGAEILLLVVAVTMAGCANLRIPQIDPSGRQIFLPPPSYTTPTVPQVPQPAYAHPPTPPPCANSAVGPPASANPVLTQPPTDTFTTVSPTSGTYPNSQVGVVIKPRRMIAPVGSVVVLKAGVCGVDGSYLTKESIEWFLSEESVGQITSLGNEGRRNWLIPLRQPPRKVTGSYAIGRTSRYADIVNPPSSGSGEDVWLLAGETWLTVTSGGEGISRITVHAPEAIELQQRQQTATIHWVDAQWVFPPPVITPSGKFQQMVTTVTRASDASAAVGWIVRYQVIGGLPAGLGSSRAQVVEVPTDSQGVARVKVSPLSNQPGVTQLGIQVIQPPTAHNGHSRLVIGQGGSSVTWSSPRLTIRATGPEQVEYDGTITYRIEVANEGDLPASDVVVDDRLPEGIVFLNSEPPAEVYGDRLQWQVGDLRRGARHVIELNCRAERKGRVNHYVKAESANGWSADASWVTSVLKPAFQVEMTGPEEADVGQIVQYKIVVTNVSQQRLTGVTAHDHFDSGLQHAEAQSPIERLLGDLDPGQSFPFAVTFIVTKPGAQCHTIEVTADNGHVESSRACLRTRQVEAAPTPTMSVRKRGPKLRRVGEVAEFKIELTNTGQLPLTNVRIRDHYCDSLQPKFASPGYSRQDGALVWEIPIIAVGDAITKNVRCECVATDVGACSSTTVTADGSLMLAEETCLEILEGVEPPARDGDAAPTLTDASGFDAEDSGSDHDGLLQLTLTDLGDPVRIGRPLTYLIGIKNSREVSDKDVSLSLVLPAGMRLKRIVGPVDIQNKSRDGRTVRMHPLAELRAREKVTFRVEVAVERGGRLVVEARLNSLRSTETIRRREETTVFAD